MSGSRSTSPMSGLCSSSMNGHPVTPMTQPNIQIVFVDSNGTKTNGPLIEIPQTRVRKRKLDDTAWNQDQTVRRFCKYLQNGDSAGLEAVVRALNRLDCWRQAVDQLMIGPSPNE